MAATERKDRIAGELQRELAHVLSRETGDARLALLSISHVRVTRDLSFADVYVVSLKVKTREERSELMGALKSAAGFFRSQLSSRVRWQKTPFLRFHYDELPETGPRLESLIDSVAPRDAGAGGVA